MMQWLRLADGLCGADHGLLRAADVSKLVEIGALGDELARRRDGEMASARREAEEIRRQAELQAQQILETAAHEAEALRRQAVEQGQAQGLQEALDAWHARRLDAALAQAASLQHLQALLADLVVVGVERLVRAEAMQGLFDKALAQAQSLLQGARGAKLRIHESDQAAAAAALQQMQAAEGPIELVIDRSLQPGDCLFESEWGCVDAGLRTQLQALRAVTQRCVEAVSGADGS